MEKKEIYRGGATMQLSSGQTLLRLALTAFFCVVAFWLSQRLPLSWFFELCTIIFASLYINKVLKGGVFKITYILYEDSLVVVTRYGLIEKETARYSLDEAVFSADEITVGTENFSFYPDKTLKHLLGI